MGEVASDIKRPTQTRPIEAGRAFYADVKSRAARIGRNPDHIKILPGAFTIVGFESAANLAEETNARELVRLGRSRNASRLCRDNRDPGGRRDGDYVTGAGFMLIKRTRKTDNKTL